MVYDIFSEKTQKTLPPHQPYDHVINLKSDFIPKIAKIYSLNPAEREICRAFIDKHLRTGQIVLSKSLQASPFFFIPKKDGTLCPCQDHQHLNLFTIHNAYSLPLIQDLIDDMKDSTLFTKFNIQWGHNNIWIQEKNQWKAAFITPEGLFELTVMFFRFSNAPPTFQAFMNHIFADMWEMAQNLHGWSWNPHQGWHYPSPWTNSTSTSSIMRTWTNGEIIQNHFWCPQNGVLRDDHWRRQSRDGQKEAWSNWEMETLNHSEGGSILYRIHKLLLQIYPQLLWHCWSTQSSNLKKWTLALDPTTTKHIRQVETHLLLPPCASYSRCLSPLFCHDWCLSTYHRSNPSPNQHKWWPPSMHLFLPYLLPCTMQLWHIWQRTSGSNPSTQGMASISPWH